MRIILYGPSATADEPEKYHRRFQNYIFARGACPYPGFGRTKEVV